MLSFNSLSAVALGLSIAGFAHGQLFTLSCAPLTLQRADPIIFPGVISPHVHAVVGGNNFQQTMSETTALQGTGTTCDRYIDQSNYWVPALYNHNSNDTFSLMEFQGFAVYYLNRACDYEAGLTQCASNSNATAPPAGLRMVAGNPTLRTFNESSFAQQAIQHVCLTATSGDNTYSLPPEPCERLRSEIFFPSCWDGVNLDSANHQSHMAYPINSYNGGVCPEDHPVAIYSIFIESFWNTEPFPDYTQWTYAMGDPTGYGLHADFINGWTDQTLLEDAIATCQGTDTFFSDTCSVNLPGNVGGASSLVPLVAAPTEDVGLSGPIPTLPGNNPVTGTPI